MLVSYLDLETHRTKEIFVFEWNKKTIRIVDPRSSILRPKKSLLGNPLTTVEIDLDASSVKITGTATVTMPGESGLLQIELPGLPQIALNVQTGQLAPSEQPEGEISWKTTVYGGVLTVTQDFGQLKYFTPDYLEKPDYRETPFGTLDSILPEPLRYKPFGAPADSFSEERVPSRRLDGKNPDLIPHNPPGAKELPIEGDLPSLFFDA